MSWTKLAVLLTALGLLSVTSLSVTCWAAGNPNEVPFKLYRGYAIVVCGSIGGLKDLNLLIDTGAVPSVLDARIARRLHLRGLSERVGVPGSVLATERVTVPDVEIGPSHLNELSVIVSDLSFAEEALEIRIDALIGFDVLGQSSFTIDYESRRLVFGPVDASFVAVSYSPGLPYAIVLLHIQGETLAILVDTGASNLVLFQSGVQNCPSAIHTMGRETWTSMGGEMPAAKAHLTDTYLGAMPWGERVAYIPENTANQRVGIAGLLGTVTLGKRVAFDPVRRVVAWEAK
jgi:predicted aspartyl protease